MVAINKRASIISLCLTAAVLLTGCDALQLGVETSTPAASPTAQSSPTAVPTLPTPLPPVMVTAGPVLPNQPPATATMAATEAPATGTSVSPTGQPTSDKPTVVPGPPGHEAILILYPGTNSSATSRARVLGQSDPTFEQNVVVQISDAGGALIATLSTTIGGIGGPAVGQGPFEVEVPFSVNAQQPGRISVFSISPRDGGLVHLASVDVTLLTGGTAAINPGLTLNETQIILEPALQASITGGKLHVSGFSDYVFESQLSLALCWQGVGARPTRSAARPATCWPPARPRSPPPAWANRVPSPAF
jgi:Immunoglobulin-like domain of bacterial spore germination